MQLHELKSQFKKKSKKRVGRGGKRGTTSGKGQKGQKSRAGHRIKPAEREFFQRLPKLRGLKNKSLNIKPIIINLEDLDKRIKGDMVDKETMVAAGLMRKSDKNAKILGNGEIKRALRISGLKVSDSAKKKIEAAGGGIITN